MVNRRCPSSLPPNASVPVKKHLQVSYVNGEPKVLGPGVVYQNFREEALQHPKPLFPKDSLEDQHQKLRFSQWKYVDYENDGDLDLIVGIDEWGDYGWDNAYDAQGNWTNGPLHGYVYWLENENGSYAHPRENTGRRQPGGCLRSTHTQHGRFRRRR